MEYIKLTDLKEVLKSVSLSNEDITRFGDGFEKAMTLVNKGIETITVTPCCETLKDKEETAFDLWLKNFKKTEYGYWFDERTVYCYEAMKDIYKTSVKPNL